LDVHEILRKDNNGLGSDYHDDWDYALLSNRHDGGEIGRRLTDGWSVVRYDVPGSSGEVFTLLGRPRQPAAPPKPVL
jgi:fermentation-respiration switch protein FrsA (DUF1100 family)